MSHHLESTHTLPFSISLLHSLGACPHTRGHFFPPHGSGYPKTLQGSHTQPSFPSLYCLSCHPVTAHTYSQMYSPSLCRSPTPTSLSSSLLSLFTLCPFTKILLFSLSLLHILCLSPLLLSFLLTWFHTHLHLPHTHHSPYPPLPVLSRLSCIPINTAFRSCTSPPLSHSIFPASPTSTLLYFLLSSFSRPPISF